MVKYAVPLCCVAALFSASSDGQIVRSSSAMISSVPRGQLPSVGPRPTAYHIDLTVLPDQARFRGHVVIDVDVATATSGIYLHGKGLKVDAARVRAANVDLPASWIERDKSGVAQLVMTQPIPPGRATITVDYSAPFATAAEGLYHAEVGGQWYAWSQFQSIYARAAFPSFDEPGFKTPFFVAITTPKGLRVVSNSPETRRERMTEGLERHVFAQTQPLPTYLLAFDVGPFASAAVTVPPNAQRSSPIELRTVATQANASRLHFVNAQTPKIIEIEEAYFGEPLPVPKMDQVGSPLWDDGGMENSGAITYGDNVILLDDAPSDERRAVFGEVVAHELAHQWFGNLVTPRWWDDIWLNEAFATWMGLRAAGLWAPDMSFGLEARVSAFRAMNLDALSGSHPVHQHIETSDAVDAAFDRITYDKGEQVVSMFAAYLGDQRFREGVRLHLSRHRFDNATTADFFGALEESAREPGLSKAMQGFVDQPGIPLVTFVRDAEGLVVRQSAYATLGVNPASRSWSIPVCIDDAGTRRCSMLDRPVMHIAMPKSGIIVPNADGVGYYRFDMSPTEWAATLAALPRLPSAEALAVDDSLWASFAAGRASADSLLTEIVALATSSDPRVRLGGARRLGAYLNNGLVPSGARANYRAFARRIYQPFLQRLGVDPSVAGNEKLDLATRAYRRDLTELLVFDLSVRERLTRSADNFLAGHTGALDVAYQPLAFGLLVQDRGIETAKRLLLPRTSGTSPISKIMALRALGRSRRVDVAGWALGPAQLSTLDRTTVARMLSSYPETRAIGLAWLLDHPDDLGIGPGLQSAELLTRFFGDFCSVKDAALIRARLGPVVQAAGTSSQDLDRAVALASTCGRLKAARRDEIATALRHRTSSLPVRFLRGRSRLSRYSIRR